VYENSGLGVRIRRNTQLVDWEAILDRTRNIRALPHWSDAAAIVQAAADSFAVEKWAEQPRRVEVWIEKDALVGVFEPVCQELDVPLFSWRGYTSQSEVWGAAQRLERYLVAGQEVVILHFGDHDPSGLDMTRDIRERLRLFLLHDWIRQEDQRHALTSNEERREWLIREHGDRGWDTRLDVRRLALTWDEVQQYTPPPNPAKSTDARYRKYMAEFGDESWELDALEPAVLGQLVRDAVDSILDHDRWDAAVEREQTGAARLQAVSQRWAEVEALVG
jgi:hypothetical protein